MHPSRQIRLFGWLTAAAVLVGPALAFGNPKTYTSSHLAHCRTPPAYVDPEACYGYFPTCWKPWHVACPGAPVPVNVSPAVSPGQERLPTPALEKKSEPEKKDEPTANTRLTPYLPPAPPAVPATRLTPTSVPVIVPVHGGTIVPASKPSVGR